MMSALLIASFASLQSPTTQSPPDSVLADSVPAPLTVTQAWAAGRPVAHDASLAFRLGRPLLRDERLALVVGAVDLAGFATDEGTTVTLHLRSARVAPGSHEVIAYSVTETAWTELGRFPVMVLTRGGFESMRVAPSATLNNVGQLAERTSALETPSPRRTFQDFTGSAGVQAAFQRRGVTLETQWNVAGTSEREQALRFSERQQAAPLIDLADFSVSLRGGPTTLSLGSLTLGQQRHLVQQFPSRGVTASVARGPATLTLAAANGSSIVGWNNLLGVSDGRHLLRTAMLAMELVPNHPGSLRLETTVVDGSTRPNTGVARGAIVDAERGGGQGIALDARTPGQRVRLRAEWARSRLRPARDDELTDHVTLVPLGAARGNARYAELGIDVLRQRRLLSLVTTDLSVILRHERVDPLYRSVATSPQADRQDNGGEVALTLGALGVRVAYAASGDNLGDVPSVLRTENRQTLTSVTLPLGQAFTRIPRLSAYLPLLSGSWGRTHAVADDLPTNGDFRPVDLPDQLSTTADASAQWTLTRWRVSYRFARSAQDNRQAGRERADFATDIHAVSVGFTPLAVLDVGVDATDEQQTNEELDQSQRLRRLGVAGTWQLTRLAQFSGGYTATVSRDRPATTRGTQADLRAELSHGFDIRGGADGGNARGRLFVRYQRLSAETQQRIDAVASVLPPGRRLRWNVATGLSYRVL